MPQPPLPTCPPSTPNAVITWWRWQSVNSRYATSFISNGQAQTVAQANLYVSDAAALILTPWRTAMSNQWHLDSIQLFGFQSSTLVVTRKYARTDVGLRPQKAMPGQLAVCIRPNNPPSGWMYEQRWMLSGLTLPQVNEHRITGQGVSLWTGFVNALNHWRTIPGAQIGTLRFWSRKNNTCTVQPTKYVIHPQLFDMRRRRDRPYTWPSYPNNPP